MNHQSWEFGKAIRPLFAEPVTNVQNICGLKSETMWCVELEISMSGEHQRYYKHTNFCQNPRGDPKFLVDFDTEWPIYNTKTAF